MKRRELIILLGGAAVTWPLAARAQRTFPDMFRRAATFVDKILKGARPRDLPVERSTKFITIVNLKTAKALGLDMPTSLFLRADEVIE